MHCESKLDQATGLLIAHFKRLIFIDYDFISLFFSHLQADGSRYTNGNEHSGAVKGDTRGMDAAKNSGYAVNNDMVSTFTFICFPFRLSCFYEWLKIKTVKFKSIHPNNKILRIQLIQICFFMNGSLLTQTAVILTFKTY